MRTLVTTERARSIHLLVQLVLACGLAGPAAADLVPGLLNDFQGGSLEGWADSGNTQLIADGGPLGAGDGYLQISPGNNIASYTTDVAGVIDPSVFAVAADLMRPSGQGDLEVRLVLFGPSDFDRWTSTLSVLVPDDGVWRTYDFSTLEGDLTHVLGAETYADLAGELGRIMFRNDPGSPSPTGVSGTGTLNVDNVIVVPEPSTAAILLTALATTVALARTGRRA
jgi:hypothetical protein